MNSENYTATSRSEAKALGHKKYFTGRECINGHVDLRHTSSASCVTCDKEKAQRQRDERGDEINALRRYRTKHDKKHRDKLRLRGRERYKKDKDKIIFQRLKAAYGLNKEEFHQMLNTQNHQCAICGSKDTNSPRTNRLYVDHCHKTNKVRGLLCHKCNFGIGNFNDDIKILSKAIKYLTVQQINN